MRRNVYKGSNDLDDFTEEERLIAKYLADIFRQQIPDEEIPKPDLSFMYEDEKRGPRIVFPFRGTRIRDTDGRRRILPPGRDKGSAAALSSSEAADEALIKKRRFTAARRVATAFCVICVMFIGANCMTVFLLNEEAFAGNAASIFFNRCIGYIISNPENEDDFSDENSYKQEIFDESKIYVIKEILPEMMLVGSVPERYEFTSLTLEEYEAGDYFTYVYQYSDPSNAEDILCLKGEKKLKNDQLTLFGENVQVNSVNLELYCQDDSTTGGVTGTCVMSNQILTISGKLDQEEVVAIAESLFI